MSEEYVGQRLLVRWDIMKCAHAGRCVKALPAVFNVKNNPWVAPDAAEAEAVKDAVRQCPSGALSCEERSSRQG